MFIPIYIFYYMGVDHHLTNIGVISSVTTAIGSKICSFHLVYKNMYEFECYRMTYWNEVEELWKGSKVFGTVLTVLTVLDF